MANQALQNSANLVEDRNARNSLIGRVEVLDKVKKLFLIPELEVMTSRMVADYYEVDFETLKSCYKFNREEIDADGVFTKSQKDFVMVDFQLLDKSKAGAVFETAEGFKFIVPNSGTKVFSKRAVLRIGMLLRDSAIAKEVRTQLLNTFEHATVQQRTAEIDEETALALDIANAITSGDVKNVLVAFAAFSDYQNRHIETMKKNNEELTENYEIAKTDN
jgi:hypothetical protein